MADRVKTNKKPTFSASSAAFTPPATPTDLATIAGAAGHTVFVTKVKITTTQTTAGINVFNLVKRSTANTAGTATALTAVPHDSNNSAAIATVQNYTANPTTGTPVGTIEASHILSPAPASLASGNQRQYTFSYGEDDNIQPIALRGTGQMLAVNFGGAALPTGLSVIVGFEWYEE